MDIDIFIYYKHLNIVGLEPLTFRLPFGGHGKPWIRLKIGPHYLFSCNSGSVVGLSVVVGSVGVSS